ncbi:MAG: GGDEF domain-containing protein [Halieaceae bacterium]|jgi:diguanylate cyclase (GGDEF)-like protein|nr:GGDEF domain-containing protein [Halieaceae bacterium]
MLYQPKVPAKDLLSARLELQLQSSRYASLGAQAVGVVAVLAALWFQVEHQMLMIWAGGMMALLLLFSLRMGHALSRRRYYTQRRAVYLELLAGSLLTGWSWSATVAWFDPLLNNDVFSLLLLIVTIISVVSIAVTVVLREVYIAFLFASLITTAAWLGWHYDARPNNPTILALILGLGGLLTIVSGWMSQVFGEMVETNLERAAMAEDLANLSDSLRVRNVQLQEARRQLADLATIDDLTGLRNRRGIRDLLEIELSRAKRSGLPLALIMLDVDHFKLYNDTYGHPAGDLVLQRLAEVMLSMTARAGEAAARMGGEEFLMLLPGSTATEAMHAANRMRERFAAAGIPHSSSPTNDHVTVSQGIVACVPRVNTTIEEMIEAADKALYASKANGRDQITLSSFSP